MYADSVYYQLLFGKLNPKSDPRLRYNFELLSPKPRQVSNCFQTRCVGIADAFKQNIHVGQSRGSQEIPRLVLLSSGVSWGIKPFRRGRNK